MGKPQNRGLIVLLSNSAKIEQTIRSDIIRKAALLDSGQKMKKKN